MSHQGQKYCILDHCYTIIIEAYHSVQWAVLELSDHCSVHLIPTYRQKLKAAKPVIRTVKRWSNEAEQDLKVGFDLTDSSVFEAAATDLDELTETVTSYISFCEDLFIGKRFGVSIVWSEEHHQVQDTSPTVYGVSTTVWWSQCVLLPILKGQTDTQHPLWTALQRTDPSVKLLKFADDTIVIGLIKDRDESAYRQEVEQLAVWCRLNNLELNSQNCVDDSGLQEELPCSPPTHHYGQEGRKEGMKEWRN